MPVTLTWLADGDNGLTNFSRTQAWRAPLGSASWAVVSAAQAATVSSGTRSLSFSTTALGRLTLGATSQPLPATSDPGADALLR